MRMPCIFCIIFTLKKQTKHQTLSKPKANPHAQAPLLLAGLVSQSILPPPPPPLSRMYQTALGLHASYVGGPTLCGGASRARFGRYKPTALLHLSFALHIYLFIHAHANLCFV